MTSLTLEHLKKFPEKKARFEFVRIWSGEHQAWWRKGGGYTVNGDEADLLTMDAAWASSHHCGPEKKIHYQTLPNPPLMAKERIRIHRERAERKDRRR